MNLRLLTFLTFLSLTLVVVVVGLGGRYLLFMKIEEMYIEMQMRANASQAARVAGVVEEQIAAGASPEAVKSSLQESLEKQGYRSSSFLCLLSEDFIILSHPDTQAVGTELNFDGQRQDTAAWDFVFAGTPNVRQGFLEDQLYGGGRQLVFQYPLQSIPWYISVHSAYDEVKERVNQLQNQVAYAAMQTFLGFVVLGTLAVRLLERGYEKRIEAANAELEKRVAERGDELKNSQLKLMEAEKMNSVGRLAAGVAHEVKNPLAVVQMGVEYIEKRLDPGKDFLKVVMQDMKESINRADSVIYELLDFASPHELVRKAEDLSAIMENSLHLLQPTFAAKKVTLIKDLASNLPMLDLEAHKIDQAFVNILMNAINAMPGGGKLMVRTFSRGEPGEDSGGLRFNNRQVIGAEIKDTGIGIPPDRLTRIFDPFYTSNLTGKGTGLGLAVTKNIIEMHGGRIRIENRKKEGVRVLILFELKPSKEDLKHEKNKNIDYRR